MQGRRATSQASISRRAYAISLLLLFAERSCDQLILNYSHHCVSGFDRFSMSIPSVLAMLLLAISYAIASPLSPRAGAPIPKPIPSNCSILNPVLCTSAASCPPVSYTQFRPTPSALTPALSGPFIYAYYLPPDSFQVTSGNSSSLLRQCLETCNGYGNTGDCKSVYQAYNYPSPPLYGAPGGQPTVACLLFNRVVGIDDFEVVPEAERGGWTDPRSAVIQCPTA